MRILTVRPDPYLARIVPAGPNPALALRFGHAEGVRSRTIKVTRAAGGLALALGRCWVVARRGARLFRLNHAVRRRIAVRGRFAACHRPGDADTSNVAGSVPGHPPAAEPQLIMRARAGALVGRSPRLEPVRCTFP